MQKGYSTQTTKCNGFKIETRTSRIGARTFVWLGDLYIATYKTKCQAFNWAINQK